ncbi:hypothetical protein F0169_15340 [Pseudomonas sp. MAFF 212408]|uniref:DUF2282 domain-containing protein n=1 Tax=Pseudomonas kitaguniensis TaxID=2607908 RepID=A0A5N7KMB8_9PSED|nr:hypothetical protein [Pseudomonas kitaguniensis]MPR03326.1 hypothetical protein [Pseudomonas kitaguniensis]
MTIKSAAAGAALAMAAATMFAGVATQAQAADTAVHCYGITACKGQNDCKTKDHACKGLGACKGQGFKIQASADACTKAGGTVGE